VRLTLSRVAASHGGRLALRGVDLAVPEGGVLAVMGPSGAGKTTLLRVAALLHPVESGEVLVDGALPRDALAARRRMGVVLQRPVALAGTVLDNAAVGLRVRGVPREEAHARALPALLRMDLAHVAGRPARHLSGGELQRLAFVRATLVEPEILLLDEFTANLDPANVLALEAATGAFARQPGRSVLLCTHDVFQARRLATEVAFLRDGSVVERGGREALHAPANAWTRGFLAGEVVP